MAMAEVEVQSRCVVAPVQPSSSSGSLMPLSSFDLQVRGVPPIRRVLFYRKPDIPLEAVVADLKVSLATALLHFFPLAGRFHIGPGPHNVLSLDCNDAGAEFIVASTQAELPDLDISVQDDTVFRPFFPALAPQSALPPDSPLLPAVCIQVTQFSCGSIAIGFSVSHILVDGTSLWHFLTSWAELTRTGTLGVPPHHQRFQLSLDDQPSPPPAPAPTSDAVPPANGGASTVSTVTPPAASGAAIFRLRNATIQRLKAEATHHGKLPFSTFVSVMAYWWKQATLARLLDPKQEVQFHFAIDSRRRLNPQLPPGYCGNAVVPIHATSSAGEIASNDLAFAANLLHRVVIAVDDSWIKCQQRRQVEAGYPGPYAAFRPGNDLAAGSSVRFPIYETDFGWGRPVAVRQGLPSANADGLLLCDPGALPGSNDITAFLHPQTIARLRRIMPPLN